MWTLESCPSARGSTKTGKTEEDRQLEVDFVANQVSRRYYVQVALGVDDLGKYGQETGSPGASRLLPQGGGRTGRHRALA